MNLNKATSLDDAQCYYCTKSVPAEALNCPNCGKERKELHDLRVQWRGAALLAVISAVWLPITVANGLKYRWVVWVYSEEPLSSVLPSVMRAHEVKFSLVKMLSDLELWFVLAGFIVGIALARFYMSKYAKLSGKRMTGWY